MTRDEQEANEWFASRSPEEQAALRAGALSWPDRKMQRYFGTDWREDGPFDWTTCERVEVIPGKVSGVPLLVGTRMPADSVLQHFEWGESVDEIVEQFDLDAEDVMSVLRFAGVLDHAAIAA
jgi:uncharacterized protein (DUF433 family)